MKPSRILIYCPVFYPQNSGYANAFRQLIENMLEDGVQADVLTPQPLAEGYAEWEHPLLKVYRYSPSLPVWLFGLLYRFQKLGMKIEEMDAMRRYDMVFIETGDEPYLLPFLPIGIRNKMALRFHANSDTEYLVFSAQRKYRIKYRAWQWFAADRLSHVVTTNTYHAAFVAKHLLHDEEMKCKSYDVLINATGDFQIKQNDTTAARMFFTLGRMDPEGYKQKGFDDLLEALKLCKTLFEQTKSIFVVVGDGSEAEKFKHQLASNQLNFVRYIPSLKREEVIQYLQQSDIAVLPSRYEGLSVFALEAMAAGNAVVYSNTGGLADMVSGNGILFDPGNVQELALAITHMLNAPVSQIAAFKQASVTLCSTRFSKQQQLKQLYYIAERMKG